MIQNLLEQPESKTLEFKENLINLDGILKTIIAFANTAGGTIIIGIEDPSKSQESNKKNKTHKVIGIKNILVEELRLANAIANNITPILTPIIRIHTFRRKELLIIKVPYTKGPFFIKSAGVKKGTYIRLGSTNRIADENYLTKINLEFQNISWDELPNPGGEKEILDWRLMEKAFWQVRKKITQTKCENLGILTRKVGESVPSNGGLLLFGKNRLKLFPFSMIRCVRFLTETKSQVLDHLDIQDPLPLSIEPILNFIKKNTKTGLKITGRPQHIEVPEYKPIAIRESVINAILHADYTINSYIQIAIFTDRIEITNPGTLVFGMTMEDIFAGSSQLRNKVIGNVFRELKLIELWGSGVLKIIEACENYSIKHPKFEELGSQFRVTLYPAPLEEMIKNS